MEINSLRLSFIVPAYNVGEYINECIESLEILPINKNEFEIIIINDGSTDSTLSKCEYLKTKYNNIILMSFDNNGVSNARNEGVKYAHGKYICFVDGDDFHINNGIINLLKTSEDNDLDVARGKYYVFKDGTYHKNNGNIFSFYNKVLSGFEFLYNTIKYQENEVVPWLGLFKKNFLIKNKISFNRFISYEEDHIFFLSCLMAQKCRVMQSDCCFYAYRFRESSVTKTPTFKQAEDVIKVVVLEETIAKKAKNKKTRRYIRKYESSSFYQLTSIYGRVDKTTKKQINKIATFSIKWRCLLNPYNKHQFFKIFLFTFFRWVVDAVYRSRKAKLK